MHGIHGVGQASDAFFQLKSLSFHLRRILFASQRHASLCTKTPSRTVFLLILFSPTISKHGANGRIRGRPGHHLSSSPHSAGFFFFSFVAEFFGPPFFFIRFRIHMYNRYPESERVLVRFIKSLAGKTAKGYKRETQ